MTKFHELLLNVLSPLAWDDRPKAFESIAALREFLEAEGTGERELAPVWRRARTDWVCTHGPVDNICGHPAIYERPDDDEDGACEAHAETMGVFATHKEPLSVPDGVDDDESHKEYVEGVMVANRNRPARLPASGQDAPRHFACKECGPHVAVDEDGCCASCGITATEGMCDETCPPHDPAEAERAFKAIREDLGKREAQLAVSVLVSAKWKALARRLWADRDAAWRAWAAVQGARRNLEDELAALKAEAGEWGQRAFRYENEIARLKTATPAPGAETVEGLRAELEESRETLAQVREWRDADCDALRRALSKARAERDTVVQAERASVVAYLRGVGQQYENGDMVPQDDYMADGYRHAARDIEDERHIASGTPAPVSQPETDGTGTFTANQTTVTTIDPFDLPSDRPRFEGHNTFCNWINWPPGERCACAKESAPAPAQPAPERPTCGYKCNGNHEPPRCLPILCDGDWHWCSVMCRGERSHVVTIPVPAAPRKSET